MMISQQLIIIFFFFCFIYHWKGCTTNKSKFNHLTQLLFHSESASKVLSKSLILLRWLSPFFAKCTNKSSSQFATLRSVSKEVKVFVFMSPFITLSIRESGRALYLCLCAFVFVIVLLSLSLCYLLLRWVWESREEH